MAHFLLLIRDHEDRWPTFSPEEQQSVIERFNAWNARLRDAGEFAGAGQLTEDRGVTVRGRPGDDDVAVDGPYAEAKEAIGGFYLIEVDTIQEAAAWAGQCPILAFGGSVEVRELAAHVPS